MGRQIRKPKVCFLRVLNVVFHIQFCEINLTDSLELVEGRWWALSFSNTWSEDLNCRDKRSFWVAEVFQVCIVLHWWISMVHIFCPNPCGRKHTLNYSCSLFIHTLLCRGGHPWSGVCLKSQRQEREVLQSHSPSLWCPPLPESASRAHFHTSLFIWVLLLKLWKTSNSLDNKTMWVGRSLSKCSYWSSDTNTHVERLITTCYLRSTVFSPPFSGVSLIYTCIYTYSI